MCGVQAPGDDSDTAATEHPSEGSAQALLNGKLSAIPRWFGLVASAAEERELFVGAASCFNEEQKDITLRLIEV